MTNEQKRGKHLRGKAKHTCYECDIEFGLRREFIRHHISMHTKPRIEQKNCGRRHGVSR